MKSEFQPGIGYSAQSSTSGAAYEIEPNTNKLGIFLKLTNGATTAYKVVKNKQFLVMICIFFVFPIDIMLKFRQGND